MLKVLLSLFIVTSVFSATIQAEGSDLEKQLQRLSLPTNIAPPSVSKEKMYSFQSRLMELSGKHEVSVLGAKNFSPDNHLSSHRLGMNYRFHINSRFSAKVEGFKVFNSLNSSGKNLIYENGVIPSSDFEKAGVLIGGNYNLFYGKFRFGMETAHYFDHYLGASIGRVILKSGAGFMGQLETGFAFWLSNWGSFRLGLKDEIHREDRGSGKRFAHNIIGQLSFGLLLGGESS